MFKYDIKFIAPDYDKKTKTTITDIRMINEDDVDMLFKERANHRYKMQAGYSAYMDKGVMKAAFLKTTARTKKAMFTDIVIEESTYYCPYVPLIIETEGTVIIPKYCVIKTKNLYFYVLDTKDVEEDGKLIHKTKMILNDWQPNITLWGENQRLGGTSMLTPDKINKDINETIAFMMLATADQTV